MGDQFRETFVARYGKKAARSYRLQALELLNRMQFKNRNVGQILNRYPHELSGGESQRVMLALALVGEPQLLIADEPTTQLDALTQYRVLELIEEIAAENRLALLLITHHLGVLARMVDYVVIMFAGKVVERGPIRTIVGPETPVRHPYTRLLLQAAALSDRRDPTSLSAVRTEPNHQGCPYYHRCPLKDRIDQEKRERCFRQMPSLLSVDHQHAVACWEIETHAD